MCFADMVETIVNRWTDTDWDNPNEKRDFPKAMDWEITYAIHVAKGLRNRLAKGERVISVRLTPDPSRKTTIKLPTAKIEFFRNPRVTAHHPMIAARLGTETHCDLASHTPKRSAPS